MALRTLLAVSQVNRTGAQCLFTPSDQLNGCSVVCDGGVSILAQNATLLPQTVTFAVAKFVDGDLTVNPRVVTVQASTTLVIGPFPAAIYAQQDGTMWIDCSVQMGLLAIKH